MQSDEVFLEAQVQNVTNGVLSLEKVLLEPSQLFGVTSLNAVQEEDEAGNAETRLGNVLYKLKWDKKVTTLIVFIFQIGLRKGQLVAATRF